MPFIEAATNAHRIHQRLLVNWVDFGRFVGVRVFNFRWYSLRTVNFNAFWSALASGRNELRRSFMYHNYTGLDEYFGPSPDSLTM